MRLVIVTGTGTEVGKTFVSAALARSLRDRGVAVSARKPLQSYEKDDPPSTLDSAVLAAATGEEASEVCSPDRSFPVPMAPPMAAAVLGRVVPSIRELVSIIGHSWPPQVDVALVEGAGGVRSPLGCDGDTADLADLIDPRLVVLVADAGLGTINLVRLSCDALDTHTVAVFLNRFDPDDDLHRANRDFLAADGYLIVTSVEELADIVLGGAAAV